MIQNQVSTFAKTENIEVNLDDVIENLGPVKATLQGNLQGEPTQVSLFEQYILLLSKGIFWGSHYKLIPISEVTSCHQKGSNLYFTHSEKHYALTDTAKSATHFFIQRFYKHGERPQQLKLA